MINPMIFAIMPAMGKISKPEFGNSLIVTRNKDASETELIWNMLETVKSQAKWIAIANPARPVQRKKRP